MARARATPVCSIRTFPTCSRTMRPRSRDAIPGSTIWNPVNEPMTTARFSCLYGHWHPHLTDIDATFRALVNQCLAIKRSIEAIRKVVPNAKLLRHRRYREDASRPIPFSIRRDHENDRRWLTFDLLAGRVVPGHPLSSLAANKAASEEVLAELATGAGNARPDRLRPLSDQRALPRSSCRALSRRRARLERPSTLTSTLKRCASPNCRTQLGPRCAPAGNVGPLPHPDRRSPKSTMAAPATSRCAGCTRSGRKPKRRGERRRPARGDPVGGVRRCRLAFAADPARGRL